MSEDMKTVAIPERLHAKVNRKRVEQGILFKEAVEIALTAYVEDRI